MDGFTGFKTAASEELPEAVAVIDPFIGHLANLRSQPARRLLPPVASGGRRQRRPR